MPVLVVRSGSDPLALTAPEATNEIDQCTSASTAYPPEPQLASTYGFRPASPGRQRVSYRCRTASAGGGPGAYGPPRPPSGDAPSPRRRSEPEPRTRPRQATTSRRRTRLDPAGSKL